MTQRFPVDRRQFLQTLAAAAAVAASGPTGLAGGSVGSPTTTVNQPARVGRYTLPLAAVYFDSPQDMRDGDINEAGAAGAIGALARDLAFQVRSGDGGVEAELQIGSMWAPRYGWEAMWAELHADRLRMGQLFDDRLLARFAAERLNTTSARLQLTDVEDQRFLQAINTSPLPGCGMLIVPLHDESDGPLAYTPRRAAPRYELKAPRWFTIPTVEDVNYAAAPRKRIGPCTLISTAIELHDDTECASPADRSLSPLVSVAVPGRACCHEWGTLPRPPYFEYVPLLTTSAGVCTTAAYRLKSLLDAPELYDGVVAPQMWAELPFGPLSGYVSRRGYLTVRSKSMHEFLLTSNPYYAAQYKCWVAWGCPNEWQPVLE